MEIVRQRERDKNGGLDKERKNMLERWYKKALRATLLKGRERKEKKTARVEGRWGLVEGAGRGGVSNITLMNQCQWSDEKIIKKQASAVLNTAKGKRPILLYRNTIWTGKEKWQ